MIRGRKIETTANVVKVPVAPDVIASWAESDAALGYTDAGGTLWSIGQYRDGTWFRQRRD